MYKTPTTKHIISDLNTINFLEKYCLEDTDLSVLLLNVISEMKLITEYTYLPISMDRQWYILINSGVSCFSYEPIEEKEIFFFDSNLENYDRENVNKYLEQKNLISIKLRCKNGRYYTVESNPEIRLITINDYKESYELLPKYVLRQIGSNYILEKPGIVFPNSLSVCDPKLCLSLNQKLKKNELCSNFDYITFFLLLLYGKNMKIPFFMHADLVFIQTTEINISNAKLKNSNLRKDYEFFCRSFFEKEYRDFLSVSLSMRFSNQKFEKNICSKNCSCCDIAKKIIKSSQKNNDPIIFKEGKNFYQKSDPQYVHIENELRKNKYMITFCEVLNFLPDCDDQKLLTEVRPIEDFFDIPKIQSKNIISEQEAEKNASELIALVENEEMQKLSKNQKKKAKKTQENNIKQMKLLAKKIAYEAKDFIVKWQATNKKKKNVEENKKIIAKKIAEEAKTYIDNLKQDEIIISQNLPDNNTYCEINSEEYNRRVKDWDFQKIIPSIYSLPLDHIISLFENKTAKNESLWAFDLWSNYK